MLFLAAVVILAIVLGAFPSHRYFADSLDYAFNMESGTAWVVHPHHPLMPFVPHVLYRAIRSTGSDISALDFLGGWSVCVGVLACWGVMLLLRAGRMSTATVLVGVGLFAFSRGVWYFSVTPNQHSTGLLLNVFALFAMALALVRSRGGLSIRQLVATGVLTSLAIHASKLNAGLVFPAAYVILASSAPLRRKLRDLLLYIGVVVIVAGGLLLFLAFGAAGIRNLAELNRWQESYIFQSRWWPNDLVDGLWRNFYGAIELHLDSVFAPYGLFGSWMRGFGTRAWFAWLPARIGQAVVLVFLAVETIRALFEWLRGKQRSQLQTLGLVAAIPAVLFSSVYTPEWVNCRILYLPGYVLFLSPVLERHFALDRPSLQRMWPVLLVIACLFGVNFGTKVLYESNPQNNPYLIESGRLRATLEPGDLVVCSGTDEGFLRGLYVRYATRCDYVLSDDLVRLVRKHEQQVVDGFRERLDRGGKVLIHEGALSEEDVARVNALKGTDIGPGELADFLRRHAELTGEFTVYGETYFLLGMPGSGVESDGVPLEMHRDSDSRGD